LRRLRKHWPNLRLSAVQNTSEGFFHDLLENRIDCAFPALEPKGIDLTSHKLCKLEIGLVVAMPFISGICTRDPEIALNAWNSTFLLLLINGIWCCLSVGSARTKMAT